MGKTLAVGQKSDLILRLLGNLEESQAGDASARILRKVSLAVVQ